MKLGYLDIPFELSLTEKPDMGMVKLIIDRFSEIDIPFTNPKNPKGDKVKGSGALKIWKQYVSSLNNPIDYRSTIKNEPNRMYAVGASCQGLPSSFRNSLYRYNATDTDAVCCHPTIARAVANHYDLQSDAIDGYIRNRSDIFDIFKEKIGYAHSQTKQLFNSLLYGANIPMEVRANDTTCDIADTYKKQGTALADKICLEYPNLFKDAKKRDKYQPKYSALSCYLNNIENQIVLKAMEYFASKGVPIYVYSFDGFLHGINDIPYSELNDYIFEETGIPLQFINKPMKKFIEFTNVLDLHELVPVKDDIKLEAIDIDTENLLEFDFQIIEKYCKDYYDELTEYSTRGDHLKVLRKYCDYFFQTIECSDYMVVRHSYHFVHGKKFRREHIAMKFNLFKKTYCCDKDTVISYIPKGALLAKPVFSFIIDYMNWEQRLKYPRINFYPSMEPKKFYNVFKGFKYLPSDRIEIPSIEPFTNHIKNIWCNGDDFLYQYVIRWLAQTVQKPWERTEVALVLKSAEGAGKGVILNHFIGGIMGLYDTENGTQGCFRTVKKDTDIFGQFTNTLEGCTMLFLDEMVWGGDKKARGILMALITEPTNKIEFKGVSSYQVQAFQNVVIASNEEWVVPASSGVRRFLVLECNNKYAGVQTPESRAYFENLLSVPIQDVADFLYQFDLNGFNYRAVPDTKGLHEQKILSMESSFLWLKESLEDPERWKEYSGDLPECNKEQIYERYTNWGARNRMYRVVSNNVFWQQMKDFNFKEVKRGPKGEQSRYCIFPDHNTSCELFKHKFKMDINIIETME